MADPCPICKTLLTNLFAQSGQYLYECPRCGSYSLDEEANEDLPSFLRRDKQARAKLSHVLNRMNEGKRRAMLTSDLVLNMLENAALPGPYEQLDNFILWLGKKQPSQGEEVQIGHDTEAAVGVVNQESLVFVCKYAISSGLVDGSLSMVLSGDVFGAVKLTFPGWARFEELHRGRSSSRFAFMAMQFGNEELDGVYKDHFRAAVEATGFQLKRLDEGQPAGLIDDRLRVEIRQSRFLIADLTHHNKGAYWEAGFAEGLGKPVIYTCRKDAFDQGGTHFDTNHHLTVLWEPDKLDEAVGKLKDTIRATLPEDSRLND